VTEHERSDFTEFVRLRSDRLMHFAFWMTGNWEDAKDAVQDALAKAYVAWPRIEQPDAYLHRVVANSVRDGHRARRREVQVADPLEVVATDPAIDAITARVTLASALRRLPRKQRAVIVLRYCLDLSVADVAVLLDCSTGTVKSQSSKALAKLGRDESLSGDPVRPNLPAEGAL
jgi:RNA polymerase sigma-70 factor (sigma-E family)